MKSKRVVGENHVAFMAGLDSGDEEVSSSYRQVPKDRGVTRHEIGCGPGYWKTEPNRESSICYPTWEAAGTRTLGPRIKSTTEDKPDQQLTFRDRPMTYMELQRVTEICPI